MSASITFPPAGPTTLQSQIPAYVYQQYADDDNIQAFNSAFNSLAQGYLDWFTNINLPIYTNPNIGGALLDWIAQGIYGISRPTLALGHITGTGLIDTFMANQLRVMDFTQTGNINFFATTDDIFKRIITWFFYKGDGQQLTVLWLKKRIMRFLTGTGGAPLNVDVTYPVSVAFGSNRTVTITITLTTTAGIQLYMAQVFQAAVQTLGISLPFQYSFTVNIVNSLGATNLMNVAGTLNVPVTTGWSTSSTGLAAGALWSNSNVVTVIPGATPNPYAAPVFFGLITSAQLLLLGGRDLPTSNPGVGTGQLWNSSNIVKIA